MIDGMIIEAVVQVGALETRYLRCGRGEPAVVVLTASDDDRLALMGRLATGQRVIAPLLPAGAAPASAAAAADGPAVSNGSSNAGGAAALVAWLRGVIDGLGLDRPAILLGPDLDWLREGLAHAAGESFALLEAAAEPGN